jgi:hypothetical protein
MLVVLLTLSTVLGLGGAATAEPVLCGAGELCLWSEPNFGGEPVVLSLSDTGVEECVPLSEDIGVRSFINRLSKPTTVYQDMECSTEGEFDTYPGNGTFVPSAPFTVRAVQIWTL